MTDNTKLMNVLDVLLRGQAQILDRIERLEADRAQDQLDQVAALEMLAATMRAVAKHHEVIATFARDYMLV